MPKRIEALECKDVCLRENEVQKGDMPTFFHVAAKKIPGGHTDGIT